ncbi:type IX secretion system outer membrane channel protein PorV [Mucilaginibacter sp. UYCu711]|uniref:type IX secretion system outer membrane channel protein PorV n=1 Tax=Mucilaginibacter sp. UYCu711 TaxID=3156339 RepID=UPI003D193C5F
MKKKILIMVVNLLGLSIAAIAQKNPIPVAVPFLITPPDARSSGMGEIGAATSNDAYSNYWNNAKPAFAETEGAIAFTYSPYLPSVSSGINLLGLSGFGRVGYNSSIGFSANYLTEQKTVYRDDQGIQTGVKNPYDLSLGASYSLKLSEMYSLGVGLKYIHSGVQIAGNDLSDANAVSGDIALYAEKFIDESKFSWGVAFSNLGNKINYGPYLTSFQPANLRVGAAVNFLSGINSSITIGLDANKLLVPTPPTVDENGNIVKGMSTNRSVFKGIYTSFYDAPGGVSEELQSVVLGAGAEYEYLHEFFIRAGGVYESPKKGEKRYLTAGLGFNYKHMVLDASYLFPIASKLNPYQNTFHISLTFLIEQNNGQ